MKIYINGSISGTPVTYATPLVSHPDRSLWIGRRDAGVNINARIDEVRVYGQALTSFEVQQHYAEDLNKYKDLAENY